MRDYSRLDSALKIAGVSFTENEPMATHTTFRIGGPADRLVHAETLPELAAAIAALKQEDVPFLVVGNGSNLLVPDEGLRGAVILLEGKFRQVGVTGGGRILAGAGAMLSSVCAAARDHALTGLEFAWGIPGALGGALYMNAGAYGGEMQQVVTRVFVLDENGEAAERTVKDCAYGYRKSVFMETREVILGAEMRLASGDKAGITAKMEDLMQRRRDKQPLEFPSAGSVFKRPEGYFAGGLIEQCGLKGLTEGGACISEKHAGFIINKGGATCADVERLIERIQEIVLRETGVALTPEVRSVRL